MAFTLHIWGEWPLFTSWARRYASPDFYYLTGIEEPDAILVLFGPKQRTLLFARKRSDYDIRIQGPGNWQVDKREEIYGLAAVQPLEDFFTHISSLALQTQKLYLPLTSQDNIQNSRREIERMRKSGQIGAAGVKEAMKGTRPGKYEYELEAAARFIYYTSDITRTWPVSGRFTPEQEKMYRCILDARNTVMAAMKPGVSLKILKDLAEEVYKKHGFQEELLAVNPYIWHYVGISVHDVGPYFDQTQPFEPGVVFNVEPILEFREQKIHLRLEDTVLITEIGAENLTAGVPAELEEIYVLIKQRTLSAN